MLKNMKLYLTNFIVKSGVDMLLTACFIILNKTPYNLQPANQIEILMIFCNILLFTF